ncbi:hypothetical protein N7507_006662 [Penicillium longicatenatum]|nr:hypothetical protein N7507_006662 [Penicillium longicatenatum]
MEYPHGGLSTPHGRSAFIVTTVSMAIITVFLGLRIWVVTKSPRPLAPMDYFYFAGYIFAIVYSSIFLWGITNAIGVPLMAAYTLYPAKVETSLKAVLAEEFIWATATTLVKFSMLSLYLDIFRGKTFKILAYTIGVLSAMLMAAMFLVGGLICQPIQKNWDITMQGGHCGDSTKMDLITAIINMLLDLGIVILPLPQLWKLKLSWVRKAMLSGIFGLGLLICAMNLTRVVFVETLDTSDVTASMALIGLFSILEVNVGMICASLPAMGPLIFGTQRKYSNKSPGGSSGMMNSFVRRRATGRQGPFFSEGQTLYSITDEDALPLHKTSISKTKGAYHRESTSTLGVPPATSTHPERAGGIGVRTDIHIV